MRQQIERVTIIGMGALGILYGNHFATKLGNDKVTFLADKKRIESYRKKEISCNNVPCNFSFHDVNTSGEAAQFLVIAVKYTTLLSAIEMVRSFVNEDTIIISVLNGITSEELIEEHLGKGIVIPCVAQGMDAVKNKGQVTYSHMGTLCLGTMKDTGEQQNAFQSITDFFNTVQLPYTVEPDMMRRLWGKWMLNVGLNQTIMIWEGTYATVQVPGEARERMIAAMREVLELAKLEQIPITEADLEEYLALTDSLSPGGMPSMRQDGLARRYSEVDMFAGTVIEKAKKHGIQVPVNQEFYRRIQEIEHNYKI